MKKTDFLFKKQDIIYNKYQSSHHLKIEIKVSLSTVHIKKSTNSYNKMSQLDSETIFRYSKINIEVKTLNNALIKIIKLFKECIPSEMALAPENLKDLLSQELIDKLKIVYRPSDSVYLAGYLMPTILGELEAEFNEKEMNYIVPTSLLRHDRAQDLVDHKDSKLQLIGTRVAIIQEPKFCECEHKCYQNCAIDCICECQVHPPKESDSINIALLKELTGGDYWSTNPKDSTNIGSKSKTDNRWSRNCHR